MSAAQLEDLNQRLEELTVASKKTFVSQFNPGIGFVGDTIFSYTDKRNNLTGFSDRSGGFDVFLRSAELNLEATVDPFARAYAVITGSADAQSGEATMGVEEAAIITTSLPWNLTVQGGRFFADFGRFGHVHDHELPFVWRPLVLDRYIGGESRTDGAQMNYLLPTRQYVSLTLGLGDQFGESLNGAGSFRPLSEMNYWGHLSTYFDLSPNLSLETGVSGLANPTAHGLGDVVEQQDRYIGGMDLTLRYQPLDSSLHRGVVWGTEVLYSSALFEDPLGGSFRENAWGLYSYVEMKFSRRFKAGFLFQWLQDPLNSAARTYNYAPFITWNPSEFQYLRLQYGFTDQNAATGYRSFNGIYLQWDFIIGRHVHGFNQR